MNNKWEDFIFRARLFLKDELNNCFKLEIEEEDIGKNSLLTEVNLPWRKSKEYIFIHCGNVERLCLKIVDEGNFYLSQKEIIELRIAAILHDVGKLYFFDDHAKKSAELTRKWFEKNKDLGEYLDTSNIIKMIANHSEKNIISESICECILKDADILDETGVTGIFMTSKRVNEKNPLFFFDLSKKLVNRELTFLNNTLKKLVTIESKKLMSKKIQYLNSFIKELDDEIKDDSSKDVLLILKGDNSKIYKINSLVDNTDKSNTFGVVICDKYMSDDVMLMKAKEAGSKVTAFISRSKVADFNIRYFTPEREMDLCEEATNCAYHVLYENHIIDEGKYTQETKDRLVEVIVRVKGELPTITIFC